MKIGILGGGPVGLTLARLAVEQGYEVMNGSRHPARLIELAEAIGCLVDSVEAAVKFGEIVTAAIPLGAIESLPLAAIGNTRRASSIVDRR